MREKWYGLCVIVSRLKETEEQREKVKKEIEEAEKQQEALNKEEEKY